MTSCSTRGVVAEYTAAALLLSMGYQVYWPADPSSPHDLLIERSGDYLKIQVKKATWNGHNGTANRYLTVNVQDSNGTRGRKGYAYGDFDLLCAIDGARMWLIPYENCRNHQKLSLDKQVNGAPAASGLRKSYDPSRWLVK